MQSQVDEMPDEEEAEKTARETALAIGAVVDNKIQAENPKTIPAQPGAATYIKYTPAQQGSQVRTHILLSSLTLRAAQL